MRYRKLGRWGLKVSSVGLGSWLTYGGTVQEEAAAACVERAWDLGVTFFDTANAYMRGRAEEVVGRALAAYPRDQYVLATKVFFPMGDGPYDRGLSRKHVFEQCHASLRRLGTDYVDLYQCHRWDDETPLDETARAMDDLVRQGKVLYWGVSEWTADQIAEAVDLCRERGWALPVSNQPQYSAIYRRIEKQVLPTCERLGLGTVVWSPLAMGVLAGRYRPGEPAPESSRAAGPNAVFIEDYLTPEIVEAVDRLRAVADAGGVTLAQLALAWCLRTPALSSVIVGASRPEQLEETVAAADLDVDPATLEAYDRLLAPLDVSVE